MPHDAFPRRLYNKNGKTVTHEFSYINCRVARVGSLENRFRCRSDSRAGSSRESRTQNRVQSACCAGYGLDLVEIDTEAPLGSRQEQREEASTGAEATASEVQADGALEFGKVGARDIWVSAQVCQVGNGFGRGVPIRWA